MAARVLERIDGAAMLAQVEQWAAINSGTGNMAGLAAMAAELVDAFAILPGTVRLVEPAPVERMGADGRVTAVEHGRHLVVSVRPEATTRLLLFGHMDTVYPVDHPFQALTWADERTLVGPGVTDMKGGLAVMLAALGALESERALDGIGYDVLVNSDEETGSLSSAALIVELAAGKTAAFGYEPALPDGTLAGARGGTGNFSVAVHGRSAHAGRNPEEGRNALVAAADFAVSLARDAVAECPVNPARIDGGSPNNVVPDLAVLRVNFRPRNPAAIDAASRLIDATVASVLDRHDVRIDLHGQFNRPPKPIDARAARLFALVAEAGRELGLSVAHRDTGGVCDGNNVAALGVPVVDTMGVRGGAIHSPQEYLLVDSLVERAALSATAILKLAEGRMP
ncbi:hydrolase [Sphingomonas sp. KR1UV-12]|uniref:Hydrolase n=1 Tax=Sphingomonas aurea TaxID=3063994 RepID=A0ABT9EHM3_9SPHN|nr:hydrolase [Sphingomonas sp. KR1UV-12]MDP1026456.1 hydrolase [Sphingomonas sp. KR1UV-12]